MLSSSAGTPVVVGEKNAPTWSGRSPNTRVGSYWTPLPPTGKNDTGALAGTIVVVASSGPIGGGIMLVTLSGGQSFDPCSVADVIVSM